MAVLHVDSNAAIDNMSDSMSDSMNDGPQVIVLSENPLWLPPIVEALKQQEITFEVLDLTQGPLNLLDTPPNAVYINRMSPSAVTRGNGLLYNHTANILQWLEFHGRTVVNGTKAQQLEVSKVLQFLSMKGTGIRTPDTVAAMDQADDLKKAARELQKLPFIIKPNCGGKGTGVQKFNSYEEFDAMIDKQEYDRSPDGTMLIQQYIEAVKPRITRVEIVNGELVYAMFVDTADGFNLCPSDACQSGACDRKAAKAAALAQKAAQAKPKFEHRSDITAEHPLIQQYFKWMTKNEVDVAGFEFIENDENEQFTYDINMCTNYTSAMKSVGDGYDYLAKHVNKFVNV